MRLIGPSYQYAMFLIDPIIQLKKNTDIKLKPGLLISHPIYYYFVQKNLYNCNVPRVVLENINYWYPNITISIQKVSQF